MSGIVTDFRHALKLYAHTPGASAIAVVVLAVSVAVVAAFLSLYVDQVLRLHPGFERSDAIVTIEQNDTRLRGVSLALIERLADESRTLEAAAGSMNWSLLVGPERVRRRAEHVTREFFELRPRLALGRGFERADHYPDAEPVVVLSHRYWLEEYGGDPGVIGRTVEITGEAAWGADQPPETTASFRIVGVMSAALPSVRRGEAALWLPFEQSVPMLLGDPDMTRSNPMLRGFGRRIASAAAVAGELDALAEEGLLASTSEGVLPGVGLVIAPGIVNDLDVYRQTARQLNLFLAGSVLLALVAAGNVSLFLLARAPARRRELAIRLAVGARFARLARQLATEAGVLVVAAAVLGLLLAAWLTAFLRGLPFFRGAEWRDVTLFDGQVLALVFLLVTTLTLLVAVAPMVGLRRVDIGAASRRVTARATVAQRVAGTAQIAIAAAIGGAAGAFGWHLIHAMFDDPGFAVRNIHVATLQPTVDRVMAGGVSDFRVAQDRAVVELARRREAILGLPGVTGVSFSPAVPGDDNAWDEWAVASEVTADTSVRVRLAFADSAYFDLLGLEFLHGSAPASDNLDAAVVNRTLARQVWGRDDVIGEQLTHSTIARLTQSVVGVIDDFSFSHPAAEPVPTALLTPALFYTDGVALIASARGPAEIEQQLLGLEQSGDLDLGVTSVKPLAALRNDLLAPDRARGGLTFAAATLAVLLAVFGFYGTQRYLVAAGRREYAIRATQGAGPRALGRLVLGRGFALGLPGLALGAVLAFVAVAWLRGDFVSRSVPMAPVVVIVVGVLAALLVAASLGPAREARRTEPAELLRED